MQTGSSFPKVKYLLDLSRGRCLSCSLLFSPLLLSPPLFSSLLLSPPLFSPLLPSPPLLFSSLLLSAPLCVSPPLFSPLLLSPPLFSSLLLSPPQTPRSRLHPCWTVSRLGRCR